MKFDYIIQNPPYKRSLHLEFFKKGLDLLSENGKMTIIEPATWLINVRKNGKAKLYDEIKSRLGKHVKKVVIENLNREFDTALYMPFSITYIDLEKEYDKIDFWNCGENKLVNNLYDCNLVGNYDMIWSILNKCKNYGNMMKNHVYKEGKTKVDNETWFCKYAETFGGAGSSLCGAAKFIANGAKFDSPAVYRIHINGEYITSYLSSCYHYYNNNIQQSPLFAYDAGKKLTTKVADNLYGTKQELENWKHFVFNNKLPLFISLVLTIDRNNNSKEFTPWLTDKHYTDEEIYNLLGITKEEQEFIDKTIKKYERHSPWFKRYMCGKDSVSSEEVQKFIDNL